MLIKAYFISNYEDIDIVQSLLHITFSIGGYRWKSPASNLAGIAGGPRILVISAA